MSLMSKEQLLEGLATYGYSLFMPKLNQPEEVLENLLRQEDPRLLEGFPVVFLNALRDKEPLEWETDPWKPDDLPKNLKTRLLYLLALSLLLFKRYHVEKKYGLRVLRLLHKLPEGRQFSEETVQELEKSNTVNLNSFDFSYERFRNAFETYVVWAPKKSEVELEEKKEALQHELLLSEIFTPRQKMLLRKKLEGEELTKTEREYFSRVIKKRLRALADENLHQLAHRALH